MENGTAYNRHSGDEYIPDETGDDELTNKIPENK